MKIVYQNKTYHWNKHKFLSNLLGLIAYVLVEIGLLYFILNWEQFTILYK